MGRLLKIATLEPCEEESAKVNQLMRDEHFGSDVRCFSQYDEDGERAILVFTNDQQAIRLLNELNASQIRWRTYSGRYMYGSETVAVACGYGITEQDVIRATSIHLERESLGLGTILYLK